MFGVVPSGNQEKQGVYAGPSSGASVIILTHKLRKLAGRIWGGARSDGHLLGGGLMIRFIVFLGLYWGALSKEPTIFKPRRR